MTKPGVAAIVAVGVGLICGGTFAAREGPDNDAAKNLITVRLQPSRYNAGKIGSATLVPLGDKTGLTLVVSGVPAYTSRPIHLYSSLFEGSCESRHSGTRYALSDRVLAESAAFAESIGAYSGPARISHRVAVAFETLRATPFAISVRLSPADGNYEIFCGNSPR